MTAVPNGVRSSPASRSTGIRVPRAVLVNATPMNTPGGRGRGDQQADGHPGDQRDAANRRSTGSARRPRIRSKSISLPARKNSMASPKSASLLGEFGRLHPAQDRRPEQQAEHDLEDDQRDPDAPADQRGQQRRECRGSGSHERARLTSPCDPASGRGSGRPGPPEPRPAVIAIAAARSRAVSGRWADVDAVRDVRRQFGGGRRRRRRPASSPRTANSSTAPGITPPRCSRSITRGWFCTISMIRRTSYRPPRPAATSAPIRSRWVSVTGRTGLAEVVQTRDRVAVRARSAGAPAGRSAAARPARSSRAPSGRPRRARPASRAR